MPKIRLLDVSKMGITRTYCNGEVVSVCWRENEEAYIDPKTGLGFEPEWSDTYFEFLFEGAGG